MPSLPVRTFYQSQVGLIVMSEIARKKEKNYYIIQGMQNIKNSKALKAKPKLRAKMIKEENIIRALIKARDNGTLKGLDEDFHKTRGLKTNL